MTRATTRDVQRAVLNSQLPAPARQIVLTLTSLADFDTAEIPERFTPSLTDLTKQTGLGRSTCARELNRLESLGWVHRSRPDIHKARSEGAKTSYRLTVGSSPTAGLVPERDYPDHHEPDLAVVPQRDQPSPTAGPIPLVPASTSHTPPSEVSRARGTRIPDDFKVTPAMVAWAAEHTPGVDGRLETAKFIDWWHAESGAKATKRDWTAAWRTWMRRAYEPVTRARASPQVNGNQAMLSRAMERALAKEARGS